MIFYTTDYFRVSFNFRTMFVVEDIVDHVTKKKKNKRMIKLKRKDTIEITTMMKFDSFFLS